MLGVVLAMLMPASAGSWGGQPDGSWGKSTQPATIGEYSVEAPVLVGDLAVYPVIDAERTGWSEARTATLASAMGSGMLTVHEAGPVDRLWMENRGDRPVEIQTGEMVAGGMQDRVITEERSIPPNSRVAVAVHCVERERWSGSPGFVYAGRVDSGLQPALHLGQEATWTAIARRNAFRGEEAGGTFVAGLSSDQRRALRTLEAELDGRFDDKRVVGVVIAQRGQFVGREIHRDAPSFAVHRSDVLAAYVRNSAPGWELPAAAPSRGDALAFLD